MKCLYFFFAPESDWIDLFCYFLSHLVLKHRGNWVEKGNDKDLFDTFIQKMAKKDLNDIGVISINLEMIYSSLPHYFTLYQILFFKIQFTTKRQCSIYNFKVNVMVLWPLYAISLKTSTCSRTGCLWNYQHVKIVVKMVKLNRIVWKSQSTTLFSSSLVFICCTYMIIIMLKFKRSLMMNFRMRHFVFIAY